NSRSTVHRRSYLDYIAIKRINASGEVNGEYRFLGLYTHAAYHESITRIPVLRRKRAGVLEQAGVAPGSHDGQDLTEILEGYPREELFQISVEELTPSALAVLRLRTHRQTRLFLRKDIYGRFMSCIVYLPRDRYTTAVRLRIQEILREALGGVAVEYSALVGEAAMARLHVVVRARPGTSLPEVGAVAVADHSKFGVWRLTIYRIGSPITLTDVLPRLQHMGVEVVDEHPYEFAGPSVAKPFWIYDFGLRRGEAAQGPEHPEEVEDL